MRTSKWPINHLSLRRDARRRAAGMQPFGLTLANGDELVIRQALPSVTARHGRAGASNFGRDVPPPPSQSTGGWIIWLVVVGRYVLGTRHCAFDDTIAPRACLAGCMFGTAGRKCHLPDALDFTVLRLLLLAFSTRFEPWSVCSSTSSCLRACLATSRQVPGSFQLPTSVRRQAKGVFGL